MSRSFTRTSSQYLQASQSAVTGPPFSMACWFNTSNLTDSMVLMCMANSASHTNLYNLLASGNIAGDRVRAQSRDSSGSVFAETSSGFSVDTWHHGCGVWVSTNERRAYIDGGNEGTYLANKSPTGIDVVSVGRVSDASPGGYYDGLLAEAAIWDSALSESEVAVLAKGYSPLFVRPESLVMYWPLVRESDGENEDIDKVGGYDLVDYNGPGDAAHPRVLYPAPFVLGGLQGVVAVTPLVRRAIEKY
ncbi:MAG: LamG domain-containing protein [Planctomycetota bacterium]|jgi:hypothetical protein